MSASARGTAEDYSKGPAVPRGGAGPARAAAAALAAGGVAALAAAEPSTLYEVAIGPLEVVRRSSSAGASHGWALVPVALAAAALALPALRGARAPAVALIVLGIAALAVALVVDLPDTRASGRLPEALAYEDARARPGPALYLELAGGALLCAAGAVALLRARGAGRRRARPAR